MPGFKHKEKPLVDFEQGHHMMLLRFAALPSGTCEDRQYSGARKEGRRGALSGFGKGGSLGRRDEVES